MTDILIVQTGGTIDKDYPQTKGGYAFEIDEPAAKRILAQGRVTFDYITTTACRKDSQEITHQDRETIREVCVAAEQNRILITHGTDTMIQTGLFLSAAADLEQQKKVIVLTGASKPERFRDSDAHFNVGLAMGALQCLVAPGVYIAMNGKVRSADCASRDNTGAFQ
ncbi:uncharacterized protein LOC134179158 [Corticium candelabrum]|uniref:uncharacterized protein LOC134179158 n=1 Tax=Corticium candelabrum TaxID=121492 RepID=UPI002E262062|nr:uncharacterized protein LOC134179158 [Corticium candelabrum]